MTASPPFFWLDGDIRPTSDATAPLLSHSLHYGTGVFEGIRVYETAHGPAAFRLDDHLARLRKSAALVGLPTDLSPLRTAIAPLVHRNRLKSAYLRPLCFFYAGGLGLDLGALQPSQTLTALPWISHLGDATTEEGVALRVSPWRKIRASALPPLKLTGAYLNACIAKQEAVRAGFQEALFIDDAGYVCEATGENIFLVKNGAVVAVEHPDALPGITRDTIATLAGAERRAVHLDELLDADEVFLTGTSAEVAPVTYLDGRGALPVGPVTRSLRHAYQEAVHGRTEHAATWLTPL